MPTLEINGRRVQVGEGFRSLSPAEQDRTVDEIHAELTLDQKKALAKARARLRLQRGAGQQTRPWEVEAPDGSIIEFPASMSQEQVTAVMRERFGGPQQNRPGALAQFRQQYPQYNDLSDGELADRLHSKFYSDMPRQEFDRRTGLQWPGRRIDQQWPGRRIDAQQSQPGLLRRAAQTAYDFTDQLVSQGATLGFGDELFGAVNTPFEMAYGAFTGQDSGKGFGQRVVDAYGRGVGAARAQDRHAQERSPVASTAGEIAGAVGTGAGAARIGLTLMNAARPTVAGMAGRGAAEGATYGGLYGFGSGEGLQDSLDRAMWGAGAGALTGGALGGAAGGLAQRQVSQSIPTTEQLTAQAHKLYDAAKNSGIAIKPESFNQAAASIRQTAAREGFHPKIHPKVAAALSELGRKRRGPVDFQAFDQLRRIAGSAAKSIEPDEQRLAAIVIDKLDDFMDGLTPQQVLNGADPKAAVGLLKDARALWSRRSKASVIETAIERARERTGQYSQSGMENALRTEFRQIAMNPKRLRRFSKTEQDAIRKVARGGPVENAFRLLGKFAPRGVVSTGVGGGIGYTVGGPVGSALVFGAGEAGKRAAGAMTQNSARLAAELARAGGKRPDAKPLSAAHRRLIDALIAGQAAGLN